MTEGVAERNLRWAATLMASFAALGLRHAVISPGSRSTPLVLACEGIPALRTWVQADERSAAFLALGLAKGSGAPVALIATSGSAPAHWHPAVIEASMAGIPLLLLSADRPPEQQDCGANQTVDQARLFGTHVRAYLGLPAPDESLPALPSLAARAFGQTLRPRPGPVHVNLPFREPLVPAGEVGIEAPSVPRLAAPEPAAPVGQPRLEGRGIIVCGSHATPDPETVTGLAATLRAPILADPLSGLRFGPHDRSAVCVHADAWCRAKGFTATLKPDWVLSLGGAPVSKPILRFLDSCGARDFRAVDPFGAWPDPLRRATMILLATPEAVCAALMDGSPAPDDWLDRFRDAEMTCENLLPRHDIGEASVVREAAARAGVLFAGNSMPIRQADAFAGTSGKHLRLLANRGVSGIDGSVSTFLGLAATSPGPAVGLIGDFALFHDMNGLLVARDAGLSGVLAVLNNEGGGIFEYLPQAGLPGFARHWLAPTGLAPAKVAALFDLPFRRAAPGAEFAAALSEALAGGGMHLLEVPIDRAASVAAHKAYWAEVVATLDGRSFP
jgi:2-succinyl-5-enolpyruvyl-6-hydroxy-3-cyclohexene-1-carboxylate synthase